MFFMPDGDSEFKTILGAMCSIIIWILALVYAGSKAITLFKRDDYLIQFQEHELAFGPEDRFGFSDGFMIAAVVTGFDLDRLSDPDPKYGEMRFYYKKWDRETTIQFEQLKMRSCNENDFDFGAETDPESGFFPLHKNAAVYKA